MKINKIYYIVLFAISLSFVSCDSDDEIFSKEVKVYMNTFNDPVNILYVDIIVSEGKFTANNKFKFPIRITREIQEDVFVGFKTDTSFVSSYNLEKELRYKYCLKNICKISANPIKIQAGKLVSRDSVSIEVAGFPEKGGQYLIPIVMTNLKSNDKGVELSSNMSVLYLIANVEMNNIDPNNKDFAGVAVDRKNWKFSLPKTKYGAPANIIDGDNSTYYLNPSPVLVVDMGITQTLKGFKVTPCFAFNTFRYNSTKITVYTSDDGKAWVCHSSSECEAPKSLDDVFNIKFFTPVDARYFKLKFGSGWIGFSEVNAIK